jgi:hypothetical protein
MHTYNIYIYYVIYIYILRHIKYILPPIFYKTPPKYVPFIINYNNINNNNNIIPYIFNSKNNNH